VGPRSFSCHDDDRGVPSPTTTYSFDADEFPADETRIVRES